MTPEQIQQRIAALEEQRLNIVAQAQHAIGMCDGEIACLRRLQAAAPEPTAEPTP